MIVRTNVYVEIINHNRIIIFILDFRYSNKVYENYH